MALSVGRNSWNVPRNERSELSTSKKKYKNLCRNNLLFGQICNRLAWPVFFNERSTLRARTPLHVRYCFLQSPRHYVVRDSPDRSRRAAEEQYSYSYTSESSSRSGDPYSRPVASSYVSSESVKRSSGGGPGAYSYSTERSSRSYGDGPGGYHSSYSSTTSGRLPGGTSYRHYSYRV